MDRPHHPLAPSPPPMLGDCACTEAELLALAQLAQFIKIRSLQPSLSTDSLLNSFSTRESVSTVQYCSPTASSSRNGWLAGNINRRQEQEEARWETGATTEYPGSMDLEVDERAKPRFRSLAELTYGPAGDGLSISGRAKRRRARKHENSKEQRRRALQLLCSAKETASSAETAFIDLRQTEICYDDAENSSLRVGDWWALRKNRFTAADTAVTKA